MNPIAPSIGNIKKVLIIEAINKNIPAIVRNSKFKKPKKKTYNLLGNLINGINPTNKD